MVCPAIYLLLLGANFAIGRLCLPYENGAIWCCSDLRWPTQPS